MWIGYLVTFLNFIEMLSLIYMESRIRQRQVHYICIMTLNGTFILYSLSILLKLGFPLQIGVSIHTLYMTRQIRFYTEINVSDHDGMAESVGYWAVMLSLCFLRLKRSEHDAFLH